MLSMPVPFCFPREEISFYHRGSGCQLGDVVMNQQIAPGSPPPLLPYLNRRAGS
jgi:hypothetical protein